uniref:Uncharacterized protein n=1 Tax=Rhizophora mucronata TaxID=61149 RepID=A0A2P2P0T5_RHIMU
MHTVSYRLESSIVHQICFYITVVVEKLKIFRQLEMDHNDFMFIK